LKNRRQAMREPTRRAAPARSRASGRGSKPPARERSALDIAGPDRSSGYATESLHQDGRDGALWSPLWRLRVELTSLERALLQTWPVRRLHFLHHNGASTLTYPLQASRLQHTLGVLALVAHFRVDDAALRAAALLHDVGHYPFCHSAELVPGVDHHKMTRHRVTTEPIYTVLRAHGMDPDRLLALMDGDPPNPLRTRNGLLHLDHLDSWARQAQAAGYAKMPAHDLLARLHLEGNNVAADQAIAEYLVRLIRKGNERHYAEGDIGPAMVLAHMLKLALERGLITLEGLANATDDALLTRLDAALDQEISRLIGLLRQEPWRILVRKLAQTTISEPLDTAGKPLAIHLDQLYDAVPLLAGSGQPVTKVSSAAQAEIARVKELVGTYTVTWT
jgi:hypothetical protein